MATAETLYTRDDIIKRALRLVGGLGQGETPTASQVSEAAVALNMLVKHLTNKGMNLWRREEITITPVASQQAYTIVPGGTIDQNRPVKIYSVDRYNTSSGISIGLIALSQSDFNSVNTGNVTSTPSQYWFEPLRTSSKIHLYPIPDASFVAAETIKVYYQAPLMEFALSTSNPDVPLEFYDLLVYGLAHRLSIEYGVERFLREAIRRDFIEIMNEALSYNAEDESIYFQPDRQGW
jgi:hypothetical protein